MGALESSIASPLFLYLSSSISSSGPDICPLSFLQETSLKETRSTYTKGHSVQYVNILQGTNSEVKEFIVLLLWLRITYYISVSFTRNSSIALREFKQMHRSNFT